MRRLAILLALLLPVSLPKPCRAEFNTQKFLGPQKAKPAPRPGGDETPDPKEGGARPLPVDPPQAPTEPAEPGWAFDKRSGCRAWAPEVKGEETILWSGRRCNRGPVSGEGELQVWSGERVLVQYSGTFAEGRLSGPGIRITMNGDQLEAPFKAGRANGQGTQTSRDGRRYEGMFQAGLFHGRGTMIEPSGARYEGDWVEGRRSGNGQQIYADGARYAGGWRADRPNGIGTMLYANGNIYEGSWAAGRRDGRGTLRWFAPGRSGIYTGEWRNDQRNGQGRESFDAENGVYEGSYSNDRPQGRGTYVFGGRDRFEGEVSNGCLHSTWRTVGVGRPDAECR